MPFVLQHASWWLKDCFSRSPSEVLIPEVGPDDIIRRRALACS